MEVRKRLARDIPGWGIDLSDAARPGEFMNAIFRADRYPIDHPGLKGRNLTPGDTIETYRGMTQSGTSVLPASATTSTTMISETSTTEKTAFTAMTGTDTPAESTTMSADRLDFALLPESILAALGVAAAGLYVIRRRLKKQPTA